MANKRPDRQVQKRLDARQISPSELLKEGSALRRRLTRALDDWDAGDEDSIRDVAVYTRTLIGFGKGDGLLRRLQSTFKVALPPLRLYRQPDVSGEPQLSVGGMIAEDDHVDEYGNTYVVSFAEWSTTTVVVSETANRRKTDWAQFVTDYGNTYGAHVSATVPRVLEDVQVFRGPNGHMGGYLLRAAGIVAERSLGAALRELGEDVPVSNRLFHPTGISVTGLAIGKGPNPWHAFGGSVSVPGTFQIIGMPLLDKYMTATWHWDGKTRGGSITFNFDAPR